MNGSSRETPPHMDGTTKPEGIEQQLSDRHSTLYNSISSNIDVLTSIKEKVKHDLCIYDGSEYIITTLRKDFVILQLYLYLFNSTTHCS